MVSIWSLSSLANNLFPKGDDEFKEQAGGKRKEIELRQHFPSSSQTFPGSPFPAGEKGWK